jgi:hypothetical protein
VLVGKISEDFARFRVAADIPHSVTGEEKNFLLSSGPVVSGWRYP